MSGCARRRPQCGQNCQLARVDLRQPAQRLPASGKPRNEATAEMAGKMAIEGARPLRYNGYKVPLMRNLVKRAIRGVPEASWA